MSFPENIPVHRQTGADQGRSARPLPRQRLDEPSLRRRQQLGKYGRTVASGSGELECSIHVNPYHVAARGEPQLALAGEQDVPGFVLLSTDEGVLAAGAALSIGSGVASRAGQGVVAAGPTVFGPSASLEVPAAESPDNDMDASR